MSVPQGLAHPFRFGGTGGLARASGDDKIKTNLKVIVQTALRERVMRPELGTVSFHQVLRNATSPAQALIRQLVAEAIAKHEPRVQLLSVDVRRVDLPGVGTTTEVTVGYMIPSTRQALSTSVTV